MNTTVGLVNTSITPHNYHFFFAVKTLKIYSVSTFNYIILLTIITLLNI